MTDKEDKKGNSKMGCLWLVILGFIAIGIGVSQLSTPTAPQSPAAAAPPAPAPQPTKPSPESEAAVGALTLKNAARNPDSFKLASVILMPSGAVCYHYRAQNGFGGMNVEDAYLKGGSLHSESEGAATFNGPWNKYCAHKTGRDVTGTIETMLALYGR